MHRFAKMLIKRTSRRGDYRFFDLFEKIIIREAFMWNVLVNEVRLRGCIAFVLLHGHSFACAHCRPLWVGPWHT